MDLNIKNKYALVTGGSHGIGRSIALSLAGEGCNVAICARNKDRIEKVVSEIKTKGVDAIGVSADVLVAKDIDCVVKETINAWGTVHILINNAGGGGRWGDELPEETKEEVWSEVYNKNAVVATRFTMKLIPFMRKQKWGRVVTIASIYGFEGGGRPWFTMAKSSQIALMKTLAMKQHLTCNKITFNSVAPGGILIEDTGWDQLSKENPKEYERITKGTPLGRLGLPEEVADLVVFLCSENASLINGTCISVDGGESRSF